MYKRWINILLAIWLINTVTYFHTSEPIVHAYDSHTVSSITDCDAINSWVDCLLEAFDNDQDCQSKEHHIKTQRRYVNSRTANFNLYLSVPSFHLPDALIQRLTDYDVKSYSTSVASLPAYYNFLFRLSPF